MSGAFRRGKKYYYGSDVWDVGEDEARTSFRSQSSDQEDDYHHVVVDSKQQNDDYVASLLRRQQDVAVCNNSRKQVMAKPPPPPPPKLIFFRSCLLASCSGDVIIGILPPPGLGSCMDRDPGLGWLIRCSGTRPTGRLRPVGRVGDVGD